uniref:Uncharacterized protein n=1 Tax=Panagrolaimus superbus TaxID=310955 RepID=A0A914Y310_9BILA
MQILLVNDKVRGVGIVKVAKNGEIVAVFTPLLIDLKLFNDLGAGNILGFLLFGGRFWAAVCSSNISSEVILSICRLDLREDFGLQH